MTKSFCEDLNTFKVGLVIILFLTQTLTLLSVFQTESLSFLNMISNDCMPT